MPLQTKLKTSFWEQRQKRKRAARGAAGTPPSPDVLGYGSVKFQHVSSVPSEETAKNVSEDKKMEAHFVR